MSPDEILDIIYGICYTKHMEHFSPDFINFLQLGALTALLGWFGYGK